MEITYHSWILIAIFAINLVFMFIMSLVSPFYKKAFSDGWGRIMNIVWMIVIIVITGIYMFFNVSCLLSESRCSILAWLTISVLIVVTIWIIVHSIIMDVRFRNEAKGLKVHQLIGGEV